MSMAMQNFRTWLIWQLRLISYKWPPRGKVLSAARIDRGKYECKKCKGIFGNKQISVDHVRPVVSPTKGFVDWDTYIERLFVGVEGLQVLCKSCHDEKTKKERKTRRKK